MTNADARKLATERANEYKVKGYGVTEPEGVYGGPYLDDAKLDPRVQFAFAGNPKEQVKWRKELKALEDAKKPKKKAEPKPDPTERTFP